MMNKKDNAASQATVKRVCATNKFAKSNYELGKKFEAGISLVGTEVGPVASGACQMQDAYCRVKDGRELWIYNLFIGPHKTTGKYFQHVEKRPRRLLVHKKEILELKMASAREGQTIVPLRIYLNTSHKIKVEIALGTGKKKYDKRDELKKKEIQKGLDKILKSY
jgi:SsrA-binding protein